MRRITIDAWHEEGRNRFGLNVVKWRFQCPSCGFAQTAEDWKAYGTSPRDLDRRLAFDCIGIRVSSVCPSADVVGFAEPHRGFGCVYTGAGLFRINPVEVVYGASKGSGEPGTRETFEWGQ